MLDPAVEQSVVGTWLAGNKVKFVAAPVINSTMKEIQGKMV